MSAVLDDKLARLRAAQIPTTVCDRIGALVRDGAPTLLARIAPPRLAQQWGLAEHEVLDAFLHGTRNGLFELDWNLRCPSCTGAAAHSTQLDQLHADGSCPMCELDFAGSFDDAVEVTWRVHPAVRDLGTLEPYAVFGGYAQPQPLRQLDLAPDERWRDELELKRGHYHIIKPDLSAARGVRVDDEVEDGGRTLELVVDERGIDRGAWRRRPGRYEVTLHNRTAAPLQLLIAEVPTQPWVSGAQLAAHQSFRDLFSAELIRPDESFAIRHSAFVFTDIKGSTELYERVGDSSAYALVRDHFRIMTAQVKRHGGAIVKTIGDAIMATFLSPAAALRFARDTLQAFDAFNHDQVNRDDVIVKIGVHCGPCIAVTLNERLDYFGRTINLAARIQGLSAGRDVVISRELAHQPEVEALLAELGWRQEPFGAALKGIAGPYPVIRLLPPAA